MPTIEEMINKAGGSPQPPSLRMDDIPRPSSGPWSEPSTGFVNAVEQPAQTPGRINRNMGIKPFVYETTEIDLMPWGEKLKSTGNVVAQATADIVAVPLKALAEGGFMPLSTHGMLFGDNTPTTEKATYIIGKKIQDKAAEWFPENPKLQGDFIFSTAPRIATDLAGFIATIELSGGVAAAGLPAKAAQAVKAAVRMGGGATLMGATVMEHEAERARLEGVSEEEIANRNPINFTIGAVTSFPASRLLMRMEQNPAFTQAIVGAITENALAAGAQVAASNKVAGRPVGEGVLETMAIAGGVGGVVTVGGFSIAALKAKAKEAARAGRPMDAAQIMREAGIPEPLIDELKAEVMAMPEFLDAEYPHLADENAERAKATERLNAKIEQIKSKADQDVQLAEKLENEARATIDAISEMPVTEASDVLYEIEQSLKRDADAPAESKMDEVQRGNLEYVRDKIEELHPDIVPTEAMDKKAGLVVSPDEVAIEKTTALEQKAKARQTFFEKKQAERKAAKEAAAAGASNIAFTTSKGSSYVLNKDKTTIRNKAPRPEHPGESGLQPASEKTYFVSKSDSEKLGEFQAQGGPEKIIAELPDGRIGLKYVSGKDAGKFEGRTVIPFSDQPSIGAVPVEIWSGGKKAHFGNEIVSIDTAGSKLDGNEFPAGTGESAKGKALLRQMGLLQEPETVTKQAALKSTLNRLAKGEAETTRRVRREEHAKAKAALTQLRVNLEAVMRKRAAGAAQKIANLRDRRDQLKASMSLQKQKLTAQALAKREAMIERYDKRIERLETKHKAELAETLEKGQREIDVVEGLRRQYIKSVKEGTPKSLHGRLLAHVQKVVTLKSLARNISNAVNAAEKLELDTAHRELKGQVKNLSERVVQGLSPNIKNMVQSILDKIQVAQPSAATARKLTGTADFLLDNPDADIPSYVRQKLDRLGKVGVEKLTIDEARAASDAIDRLLAQDAKIKTLRDIRNERIMDVVRESVIKELTRAKTPIKPGKLDAGDRAQKSFWQKHLGDPANALLGRNTYMSLQTYADWMFGGEDSVGHTVAFTKPWRAQRDHLTEYYRSSDELDGLVNATGLKIGSVSLARFSDYFASRVPWWMRPKQVKADIIKFELEKSQPHRKQGNVIGLTRGEMAGIVAQVRDPSTADLLLYGKSDGQSVPVHLKGGRHEGDNFRITSGDIVKMQAILGPEGMAIVDSIVAWHQGPGRKIMDDYFRREHGRSLPTDQIHMPRQRVVEPGSKPEPQLTVDTVRQKLIDNLGIGQERGHDTVSPVLIGDIFEGVYQYAWESHGMNHLMRPLQDARLMLSDPKIHAAIMNSKGPDALDKYRKVYDAMAQDIVGGGARPGFFERAITSVSRNIAGGWVGGNPWSVIRQFAGFLSLSTELPKIHLARAMGNESGLNFNLDAEIAAASGVLRHRMGGSGAELVTGRAGMEGNVSKYHRALFKGLHLVDNMITRTAWQTGKYQAEAEGFTGQALMRRAAEIAERAVFTTQPSNVPLFSSGVAVEARTGGIARIATLLKADNLKLADILFRKSMKAARDKRLIPRSVADISLAVGGGSLLMASVNQMRKAFRGDINEDQWGKEMAADTIKSALGLFYGGQVASGIAAKLIDPKLSVFVETQSPISSSLESITHEMMSAAKNTREGKMGKAWMPFAEAVADVGTAASGAPLGPYTHDFVKYMKRVESDRKKKRQFIPMR